MERSQYRERLVQRSRRREVGEEVVGVVGDVGEVRVEGDIEGEFGEEVGGEIGGEVGGEVGVKLEERL